MSDKFVLVQHNGLVHIRSEKEWTRLVLEAHKQRKKRMTSAKAVAGAAAALITFAASHFGLELPPEVTLALETLVVAAVVYFVPNKDKETV